MFRFRHKRTGVVVRSTDPGWAKGRRNYEPIIREYRNFDDLKKDELRAIAIHRGVDHSGTKDEIVERLRDNG